MARKAAEVFAALDIEKHYSKQEIFEMYVNTIYFGNGCYGVAEAAKGYFKTDAASLTDAQAVVLAGLPQAPSVYASSPGAGPQAGPGWYCSGWWTATSSPRMPPPSSPPRQT